MILISVIWEVKYVLEIIKIKIDVIEKGIIDVRYIFEKFF